MSICKWVRCIHCRECSHYLATCQFGGRRWHAGKKKKKTGSSTSGTSVMCSRHSQQGARVSLLCQFCSHQTCFWRVITSFLLSFHSSFLSMCNKDPMGVMGDPHCHVGSCVLLVLLEQYDIFGLSVILTLFSFFIILSQSRLFLPLKFFILSIHATRKAEKNVNFLCNVQCHASF